MTVVRTRFAPSPTGYLHIGGARTALFNWLYARKFGSNGHFILRIEDTDAARNTEEASAAIYEGLKWLGLDWDEGPDIGGNHGPYLQSQRQSHYDHWFAKLQESDRVYEDDGAWRFRFERKPITVHDQIAGDVTIDYSNASNTPDMVIRRSDGSYVFHFVNVVDDIDMAITHIIRGDDHLANSHKHLQLYQALDTTPPAFAHLPLILNSDGSKMSKRDAGAAVHTYITEGFLPQAVVNFLALLGWSPKDDSEILPLDEIIQRFELNAINRKSAVFDLEKCRWLNGRYLQELDIHSLINAATPHLTKLGQPTDPETLATILPLVREKVRTLSELPAWTAIFFENIPPSDPETLDKAFHNESALLLAKEIVAALESIEPSHWQADAIQSTLANLAASLKLKPGKLMFPLRVLTTGRSWGPDLMPLLEFLGKSKTIKRCNSTLAIRQS